MYFPYPYPGFLKFVLSPCPAVSYLRGRIHVRASYVHVSSQLGDGNWSEGPRPRKTRDRKDASVKLSFHGKVGMETAKAYRQKSSGANTLEERRK